MKEFIEIAKLISHPALILIGLVLWLMFGFYRLIIQSSLLQQISKSASNKLLHKLANYAFLIGMILITLGFLSFILNSFFPAL
jgi:hypothetical protein